MQCYCTTQVELFLAVFLALFIISFVFPLDPGRLDLSALCNCREDGRLPEGGFCEEVVGLALSGVCNFDGSTGKEKKIDKKM